MCGILGIAFCADHPYPYPRWRRVVRDLFVLSASRGREASGLAVRGQQAITVLKSPVAASTFVRAPAFRAALQALDPAVRGREAAALIGHTRLVTTGRQDVHDNNQPIVTEGIAGVHNGIIVNHADLWKQFPDLPRRSALDSEIIFSLIQRGLQQGEELSKAVAATFAAIAGQASIAALFADLDCLLLYTNHGSLFIVADHTAGVLLFASERMILQRTLARRVGTGDAKMPPIQRVPPGTGVVIQLDTLAQQWLGRDMCGYLVQPASRRQRVPIVDRSVPHSAAPTPSSLVPRGEIATATYRVFDRTYARWSEAIAHLRRCTRCLLPQTMPFIHYDAAGVCNYCHGYQSAQPQPIERLLRLIAPLRRGDGEPTCLVGLSGGRDSSYALHITKTVLQLNPVAYTYDWGMVTDLARRNISRLCGALGVEHVLVSADIQTKRNHIGKNVRAWLKQPELGMIPLFMAGDKPYYYYAQRLQKELGVPLTILGENLLERTDFKSGFCGVPPGSQDPDRVYVLSKRGKWTLLWQYARSYLRNPAYWNRSIPDTLWGYACYYMMRRDYLNLYRYVPWDEQQIETTLCGEYDWEMAPDTRSSWRIGDGSAAFYNYIYHTVAGFSEIDTHRSNQIREGMLTREDAIRLATEENRPRFYAIKHYCDLIGVDFVDAIRTINHIPKLYPLK